MNYSNDCSHQVPGMAYVPWQRWGEYYDPCKAFRRGTMFPILDKPFLGGARK
ncbi:MAG: spore coat associated protein CotJA [Lachnospira sp.]|nr:spore coat associated protein CotJA [Lachnospira sp.]